ncbi:MAG: glutaredoxin family protein [Actinobacteria bacterium]|nr:glutaredoxin family protein [Actinomycetota bacterium]
MPDIDIMLYTLSTCPWCRKTKKFFDERGLVYHFLDIDTLGRKDRQAARDKIVELVGSLQYPVAVINGAAVQGYNPDTFADLLKQAGWTSEG